MSEQLPAAAPDAPASHPIHLVVTDDLSRNRLTVFFRAILVIPHLIWVLSGASRSGSRSSSRG